MREAGVHMADYKVWSAGFVFLFFNLLSSSDFFLKENLKPQTIKQLGDLTQRTKFWCPTIVPKF